MSIARTTPAQNSARPRQQDPQRRPVAHRPGREGEAAGTRPADARLPIQRLEDFGDDAARIQFGLRVHRRRIVLLHEHIRQDHRPGAKPAVEPAVLRQQLHNVGAGSADRAFLDRNQRVVFIREPQDEIDVEGLREPRIGDRRRETELAEFVGGLKTLGQAGSEGQERYVASGAQDSPLADLERTGKERNRRSHPIAPRITESAGSIVDRGGGGDHVRKLGFIRGRHDHEAREAGKIADVERPRMSWAVCADEPGAVDREAHGKRLQRDIMRDLVVAALKESGVDRAERLVAFCRHSRGEGDRMLFGDPDVEGSLRERLAEYVETRAARHRCGDRDDALVAARHLHQGFSEDLGVRRRRGLRLDLGSRRNIELGDAVASVAGQFGGAVTLSLPGDGVDEDRAQFEVAGPFQNRQELVEIMPVDRPHVMKSHLLEHGGRSAARHQFDLGHRRLPELLAVFPSAPAVPRFGQSAEIVRHRPHRRRNRHPIVVQNDDEPALRGARIVQRLIGHAGGQRTIADDGGDPVASASEVPDDSHAEGGGDRRRGMRGAERIELAFAALGKAGQSSSHPQHVDTVAAAGQNLVRIGLVPHVPDEPVARRVEDVVKRNRQLDDAKTGTEMAASPSHRANGFRSQFIGDGPEISSAAKPQALGTVDEVEEHRPLRFLIALRGPRRHQYSAMKPWSAARAPIVGLSPKIDRMPSPEARRSRRGMQVNNLLLQDFEEEGGIPSCGLALGLDASLGLVGSDEIEGEATRDGHVFWLRFRCDSATDRP